MALSMGYQNIYIHIPRGLRRGGHAAPPMPVRQVANEVERARNNGKLAQIAAKGRMVWCYKA